MKRLKHFFSLAAVASLGLSAMAQNQSKTPAQPDPQMQAVLDQLATLGGKPVETLPAKQARKQPTPADAVKAVLQQERKSTQPLPVANVDNKSISGPAGKIPVRIYTPQGPGPFPVIVYYHGGGWVIADLDTYDASARALANAANAVVVSAHYRQGPEHKFPAAHEDAFTAYKWTLSNAESFKGDPAKVAVVGESAGGNLAAAVSMMARDAHVQLPVHQVLVYPIASHDLNSPSYQENADAKPLNKQMMVWFFEQYLQNPSDAQNPWIAPAQTGNLQGLPPTTIITAQVDPLRSDGQALAEKLKQAGVPVTYRNFDGVTHEFFGMGAVVDKAKEAVNVAANGLKQGFGQSAPTLAPTGREQAYPKR
jgi:acetyl esterase